MDCSNYWSECIPLHKRQVVNTHCIYKLLLSIFLSWVWFSPFIYAAVSLYLFMCNISSFHNLSVIYRIKPLPYNLIIFCEHKIANMRVSNKVQKWQLIEVNWAPPPWKYDYRNVHILQFLSISLAKSIAWDNCKLIPAPMNLGEMLDLIPCTYRTWWMNGD